MSELAEEIVRLRESGLSYNEISTSLKCSKGTISYHLGAGQKEKTKNRHNAKRIKIRKFLYEYKESHGCLDCGGKYPYFMLDFDHTGDDKLFTISSVLKEFKTFDIIKKEIAKCDVVCANCHRMRTFLRTKLAQS